MNYKSQFSPYYSSINGELTDVSNAIELLMHQITNLHQRGISTLLGNRYIGTYKLCVLSSYSDGLKLELNP